MSWFAVHETDTGVLVSVGTSVADPLPPHLTAAPLTDEQADAYRGGYGVWDDKTFTMTVLPVEPPGPTLDQRVFALETKDIEIIDKLIELDVGTEEDWVDVKPEPPTETGEIPVDPGVVEATIK